MGNKIHFQRAVGSDRARTVRETLKDSDRKMLSEDADTVSALTRAKHDPVWVFGDDGRPWRPDKLTQAFSKLQEATGIRLGCRLHDLRHYQATTLLHRGASIHEVSRRLGHKKVSTTMDVYAHLVDPDDSLGELAAEGL